MLSLSAIYVVLALSLNLVNGFTGLFSLGHAGFMAVGAYTCALLTMTPEQKEMNFFLEPIAPWLAHLSLPFVPALIVGRAASRPRSGSWSGAPVLRLKDDYLAIATLGFAEIIRVVLTNTQSITNGALGLKGLPEVRDHRRWSGPARRSRCAFMVLLTRSSYGRALKAVRDDEIAAGAMGVERVPRQGGELHRVELHGRGRRRAARPPAHHHRPEDVHLHADVQHPRWWWCWAGSAPSPARPSRRSAVTILMEALRFLDGPLNLGVFQLEARPGLRMVVFSVLLMAVVLFRQRGPHGEPRVLLEHAVAGRAPAAAGRAGGAAGGTHGAA